MIAPRKYPIVPKSLIAARKWVSRSAFCRASAF
jgi:hypothetical protein